MRWRNKLSVQIKQLFKSTTKLARTAVNKKTFLMNEEWEDKARDAYSQDERFNLHHLYLEHPQLKFSG